MNCGTFASWQSMPSVGMCPGLDRSFVKHARFERLFLGNLPKLQKWGEWRPVRWKRQGPGNEATAIGDRDTQTMKCGVWLGGCKAGLLTLYSTLDRRRQPGQDDASTVRGCCTRDEQEGSRTTPSGWQARTRMLHCIALSGVCIMFTVDHVREKHWRFGWAASCNMIGPFPQPAKSLAGPSEGLVAGLL